MAHPDTVLTVDRGGQGQGEFWRRGMPEHFEIVD